MAKDLTTSQLDRQNILNNDLAVDEIQKQTGIQGVVFEGRLRVTKSMVAIYFDVDIRQLRGMLVKILMKYVVMDMKFLKVRDLKRL